MFNRGTWLTNTWCTAPGKWSTVQWTPSARCWPGRVSLRIRWQTQVEAQQSKIWQNLFAGETVPRYQATREEQGGRTELQEAQARHNRRAAESSRTGGFQPPSSPYKLSLALAPFCQNLFTHWSQLPAVITSAHLTFPRCTSSLSLS